MKKIILPTLFTSLLLVSGCGDGSSSIERTTSTQEITNVATGYYVDSAVEGISYQCGVMEGSTSLDGAFNFEIGEGCTFSLGGFEVRNIGAGFLESKINILENNEKIAQLLQTIDNDGDASNGLQLGKESGNILKALIQERSGEIKTKLLDNLPDGANFQDFLADMKAKLQDKIGEYKGRVVPLDETISHVRETMKTLRENVGTKFRESNLTTDIKAIIETFKNGNEANQLSAVLNIGNIINKLKALSQEIKSDDTISQGMKEVRDEIIETLNNRSEDANRTSPKELVANALENFKGKADKFKEVRNSIVDKLRSFKHN